MGIFKVGIPRKGELSTWIGAGGLTALLGGTLAPEYLETINYFALLAVSVVALINKERDADSE